MSWSDGTGSTSPTVLQRIVNRARIDPNHLAAQDLDRELTYSQLIDEVTRIGSGLRARGVNEGDRVALLIPNSVDFVVAALACLQAGAVFVPLAVTDPQLRLDAVVTDCSPVLIVTNTQVEQVGPTFLGSPPTLPIDLLRQDTRVSVDDVGGTFRVAYMIYTSGTTGTPKGVQISNPAFAAAVRSTVNALGLGPATKTLCVSPFHFDGSYANLFPTLASGGTVVIRPRDALLYPRTFFNTVETEKITYSGFTPTYLRLLLTSRQIDRLNNLTLETIALGGEAVSAADLQALWSKAPAIRVFNRYGPTETTIAVTNVELTPDMIRGGTVTIGRPHPGVTFVLVDDEGKIVDTKNQIGKLYVGGVQLMDGYWADPSLTSDVMRTDVISNEILYNTGDLVYRDQFDNYVYVDRADHVVKRSGVRISLVELSALMNKVDVVESAACLTFDHGGELGIVAFVTTEGRLSDVELRRAARKLIPENMLPDRIERVTTMPLNRSNQLDEGQLLSMARLRPYRPVATEA